MAKNCLKMAIFGYIGHKRVLDAPNGVERSGTRMEQVRGHMGRWVGTFLPFRFCLQWAPEGLNMAKLLPPRLETPAAKNKNPFSVFLGPQIMKKKCDHCLTIIYIHFENHRNCFRSPKNKMSDLYGNMPYKRTVARVLTILLRPI